MEHDGQQSFPHLAATEGRRAVGVAMGEDDPELSGAATAFRRFAGASSAATGAVW